MRKLIVIRIVHTPSDMGSMQESLVREGVSKMGRQRWEENQRRIERFWSDVEQEVTAQGLDMEKVRIYQDGLPCAGDLGKRIVEETAAKGSRNYGIIKNLMDRGATIEATESPDLLRREYGYIKAIVDAKSDSDRQKAAAEYDAASAGLLAERDAFIAHSIDSTLKEGETGLLFIGASHNVVSRLARDIDVKCLD
ncbi:MAG: hypothetical protein HPY61_12185 [Methanotrichaceae archaeon]|nr:hypothetical protein [Methanotrichaceae archaeon]